MEYFHLTTPQQNIWNLQKYYSGTAIANLCGAVFFQEKRDEVLLCKAVCRFIHSQSGIRLRFSEREELRQYVSEEVDEDVPVRSFRSREEFDAYAEVFAKDPIGLQERQMYRFVVFHLEQESRSGILVALSHLVSDAWTFGLMAHQMDATYRQLAEEGEATLLERDYADFVRSEDAYHTSERYEKDKSYWKEKYAVRPEESIVKLRSASVDSVEAGRITRSLPLSLEEGIAGYCKSHPVTEAVLFETALVIYLSRINPDARTVTVGVPVLNRCNAREKEIAGMFVSTMPLTVAVEGDTEISELEGQITKGHRDLFRHQKYPYADILRQLREKQDFSGNLYDVMISYQNAKTKTDAETKWYSNGCSEVPLLVHIDNRDGKECHTINVDYQTAVFRDEAEVELLMDRLEYILAQIVSEAVEKIGDIRIVPRREYDRIVYEFNDTYVEYPREKCVHELFMEQAARTPERTALVFEEQEFTYRQLDEMSNSLAHFLREKGIGPGDVVPIIAKRSWHVIVAMLGILKAGGAYMPVSPEFPSNRIQYMFETADVKLTVTYGYSTDIDDLNKCCIDTIISLEEIDYFGKISPVQNRNGIENLCYIIFTSGSTGEPKGVAVSHRNVSNYCHNNNNNNVCHKVISDENKRIVSVTNIIFDIFVTESLLPLVNGLTIYLADDEEVMSQDKLSKLIKNNKIDVMQTTPTKMKSYMLEHDNLDYLSVLRTIILGGEILPEELYREISMNSRARVFNIYGPAETTVWSTNKEIKDERWLAHEQFERMAAINPNAIALVSGNEKYTYRELDEKSNALAQKLIMQGIGEGKVTGAYLDRTAYAVISQLAVLKAGGVFLPIDRRYPEDRIKYMLEDCQVRLVISDEELGREWNVQYINLKNYDFGDVLGKAVKTQSEAPCYVIYTSGSTGRPKGCVLKHSGVANFCVNNNIVPYAEQLDHQTVVSVNTISFDFFIAETLLPLAHGWTVVLAGEEESNHKDLFRELVVRNGVNIIETTPTRLEIYAQDEKEDSYLQQIQLIVSSGEALSSSLLERLETVSSAKIYNPLGPSECSVWNVGGNFKADITIGSPIANTQVYILDKAGYPLPIGVVGELCISGDGVGGGYLNRPDLTVEKFVPNSFATEENYHGKVMYHTGDMARWGADGEIEYLGRIDTQVKIRGLRIELGEIESVMGSFPGIGLCAVADKRDETGRQYLVGYYTVLTDCSRSGDSGAEDNRAGAVQGAGGADFAAWEEQGTGLDEKALRAHLSAKLPKYMVPNYFMRLEAMPMTASGKTDRKSLPVPDFAQQTAEYIPLETDTEKKLAEIWQGLLQTEKVGRTDDFFELGGDSLLAISMLGEIEKSFHVEISVRDIMEHSELVALAQCMEDARGTVCPDAAGDGMADGTAAGRITAHHADRYPLLPQQRAVYAACMKEPGALVYNMPARITLPDAVDRDRLKKSIAEVLDRHKLLKSFIRMEETGLYGVYDGEARIVFEEYETGKEEAFVRPFDLGEAPLVRVGFTGDALLFDMHHIIADGTSMNILLRETAALYEDGVLPKQGAEYPDYAEYFYGMDTKEHKAYFREMLKCGYEPVLLPGTKKPGTGGESRLYNIPEEVSAGARKYAKENGLTDTMVFLGAYGILLSKYTGRKEILSSIILQNRTHADTRGMVGMFVNTLPVCLTLENGGGTAGSVAGYMQEIKEKLLGLFRYQELPFEDISEEVGMDRACVNTSFVYQGDGEKALYLEGRKLTPRFMDTYTAKFDLSMEVIPTGEGCRMRLEYNMEKYDGQLMDALAEGYIRILGQLRKEKLSDVSVLSKEEYHRIVEEFNDTYVEYPREKCVHELFTEQAARTPERTALVFEDKKFTYRKLDETSNSLAHFLREKGIGPGDVVPIIAKRSWHVIVAMLGILKAGGAYMPVDPDYPSDRIGYMLTEAQAKLVMAYGWTGNDTYEVIDLAGVDYGKHTSRIENLNSSDDMCYVLYTSGSTGRPKAVCISHANMGNYNNNNNKNHCQHEMLGTCSTVLADTEFVFDMSAFEIFSSLLNGLCLVLTKEIMDAPYLAGLIDKYHADALHITPTKLLTLLHDGAFQKAAAQIKVLMVGAEVFTDNLYRTVSKYTNAAIYNGYGPTETTIGCSFKKVNGKRLKCIHELFMEQAARTPERTALVFEEQEFTYRQLDEMSNSLAHFLRKKGIGPGDVVPIIAKRSWHVIAAMLGILKAGGAYMLIDYQYPADRISYLVKECRAGIVLVYGCGYVSAVDLEDIDYSKDTDPIGAMNKIGDVLCVIHTSGSTGVPKVTALSHENIVHYINYSEKLFRGTRQTIATTAVTFDAFIQETLVSLCRQVPVILLSERQVTSQNEFEKVVGRYKNSFLFQTPTKLQNYIRNSKTKEFLSRIVSFVIGGEVFPQELYDVVRAYNPNSRIYNIYGPTETTVCAVTNELKEDADITIGTPIANTQIYILDSDQRPVPIGVPGELCIAGEGVGKGYLNRPELTAEKFVPNPFATAQNHHGKVMYRTGDLARFRNDGEIEYLGRIDTQVKIRGLRIELGEIESVMGSFPGIGLCAVADKRDETGRQYLVGYYTMTGDCSRSGDSRAGAVQGAGGSDFAAGEEQEAGKSDFAAGKEQSTDKSEIEAGLEQDISVKLDEKALRAHLSAKLPKYMAPNYFMRLEAMPMTASGKTDRKSLPMPDFAQPAGEYAPPVTDTEKKLCRLLEELLHVEQVGVTDDFFELGGDSLTAIEFLAKAHDRGIVFALQNIFDYPTIGQLCGHMEAGNEAKVHYEPADFDKYRSLLAENVIDEAFVPERKSLGNVLLTGATGFLGAHVLDELLQEETGKIYCLVRDGKEADGSERLRETLRYYFGDRYETEFATGSAAGITSAAGIKARADADPGRCHARRIIPVSGDIERDGLAENMPKDVQTVIHTAASVKHYGSYDYFNRVNVEGTKHVVEYAKSAGARLIHISTLSVSGNSMADEFAVYRSEEEKFFGETSLYIGQPLDNVYIHSKFEAERAVFDAMLTGLDARIIRVGNLTSRASDYKFQPNYKQNAFLTRVKAVLEFGLFPDYLMPLYSEFSPIDLTAEGVVKIAQYAGRQTVFHLNSNRPIYFDRFLEVVHELGIPMKVVDGGSFTRALRETIRDRGTEYIFEAFQNDMDEQGRLVYDSNIHIENDFTVWFLKKLGFEWNEIDREYIRGYVEYFREIGYLRV